MNHQQMKQTKVARQQSRRLKPMQTKLNLQMVSEKIPGHIRATIEVKSILIISPLMNPHKAQSVPEAAQDDQLEMKEDTTATADRGPDPS